MTILASISTCFTTAEKRAHLVTPSAATAFEEAGQPLSSRRKTTSAISDDQDALDRVEEQVRAKIAKHLRRAPTVYFPTTHDNSDNSDI